MTSSPTPSPPCRSSPDWGNTGRMEVLVHDDAPAVRLEVAGELHVATEGELRKAVGRALDEGAEQVVVDLARVTFIDSAGLAALLGLAQGAGARGAAFGVASPPGSEARLLIELSGTQRALGLER